MSLVLSCVALLGLALVLTISLGLYLPGVMPLLSVVVLAVVGSAFCVRGRWASKRLRLPKEWLYWTLSVGVLGSLAWRALIHPLVSSEVLNVTPFRWLFWAQLTAFLAYLTGKGFLRRIALASLLGLFVVTGHTLIEAVPSPRIDTWYFQQVGAAVLDRGGNPYDVAYAIPYGADEQSRFYGPGAIEHGLLTNYVYPPLNAMLQWPFYRLLGDIRYAMLFAILVSAMLIAYSTEDAASAVSRSSAGASGRSTSELAALFLLFQPMTLFVVEQAWTEPLVLLCFTATIVAVQGVRRKRQGAPAWRVQGLLAIALGALLTIKQYSVLMLVPPLLPVLWRLPGRARALAWTGLVSASLILPFLLWNPSEFWRDVVQTLFHQPFRMDALSLPAIIARALKVTQLPAAALAPAFVAPWVLFGLTRAKSVRLFPVVVSTAAGFMLFLFLNRQAFCNYYWLVTGLLAQACALGIEPRGGAGESTERLRISEMGGDSTEPE